MQFHLCFSQICQKGLDQSKGLRKNEASKSWKTFYNSQF